MEYSILVIAAILLLSIPTYLSLKGEHLQVIPAAYSRLYSPPLDRNCLEGNSHWQRYHENGLIFVSSGSLGKYLFARFWISSSIW